MARSRRACPERSRRNPEEAYLPHAVRSFSTTDVARLKPCVHHPNLESCNHKLCLDRILRYGKEFRSTAGRRRASVIARRAMKASMAHHKPWLPKRAVSTIASPR